MNSSGPDSTHDADPLHQANDIDAICDQFESLWKRGERPTIEEFLSDTTPEFRRELFIELVRLDYDYRTFHGEKPELQDYSSRFPEFSDILSTILPKGDGLQAAPSFPQQQIGSLLLQEVVGTGSFGRVWKAWDSELDRLVAVKLPTERLSGDDQMKLFAREAKAAAQLSHPGIVSVYSVGEADGQAYIVSQFIEGMPLTRWLKENQPTARQAALMCKSLAEALQHAHSAKVVHRDLKPGNILIDVAGNLHIADFGLAKRMDAQTSVLQQGEIVGTLAYMSPEQARGDNREIDGRSDVYSLGIILYQMLTGRLPFEGDRAKVLVQVLQEDPPPPRQHNPKIPKDLETICRKSTAKLAGDRYATAELFADDLARFLESRPIRARKISPIGHAYRWIHRRPAAAVGYFIASIAFLALMGVAFSRPSSKDDGKWEVRITTNPPGAQLILAPLDPATHEPIADVSRHIRVPSKTPTTCRLTPGMYRVVAALGPQRFAEVVRTAPELDESLSFPGNYRSWTLRGPGQVEWPVIPIPDETVTDDMILIPGCASVELGIRGSNEMPHHYRRIESFYVAPGEFTIANYGVIRQGRPTLQRDALPETSCIARFDQAIIWAEESGGRLLTEAEFEYLSKLVQLYRTGSLEELSAGAGPDAAAARSLADRLAAVTNVLSGQAEWVWGNPNAYAAVAGVTPSQTWGKNYQTLRGNLDESSPLSGAPHPWTPIDRTIAPYHCKHPRCGFRLARSAATPLR